MFFSFFPLFIYQILIGTQFMKLSKYQLIENLYDYDKYIHHDRMLTILLYIFPLLEQFFTMAYF